MSPSRLRLVMIRREEERLRRLEEGEPEEEEKEDDSPKIADLSLILQPNVSHLYLNKQVAIRNDYMVR